MREWNTNGSTQDWQRGAATCRRRAASGPGSPASGHRLSAPELTRLERALPPRYQLQRLLGTGGSSVVYQAEDRIRGREVALKILTDPEPAFAAALQRQAELDALRLPGVVRTLEIQPAAELPYAVMEVVQGFPFLPASWRVSWRGTRATVQRFIQVLVGLHEAGVVHGDLKPDNILVRPGGFPTIIDFGSASFLTEPGGKVGSSPLTPIYASPERLLGERPTVSSDLYALGVMLYGALGGQTPHASGRIGDLVRSRVHTDPPPLATLRPSAPPEVTRVIDRLVACDPHRRPPSARALHDLLESLGAWEPPSGPQRRVCPRRTTARPARYRTGRQRRLRTRTDEGLHRV